MNNLLNHPSFTIYAITFQLISPNFHIMLPYGGGSRGNTEKAD